MARHGRRGSGRFGIEQLTYVDVEHPAPAHRLRQLPDRRPRRLLFRAATTFDTAHRSTTPVDDANCAPAPRTFPHQGWVEATGAGCRAAS
jgi:hypothetical protein